MNKLQMGTAALLASLILALVAATSLGFSRDAMTALSARDEVKPAEISFAEAEGEVITPSTQLAAMSDTQP